MLFRKKILGSCEYCTHGVKIGEGQILCSKKGVKQADAHCRKFQYDPFKRIPPRFKAVDFSKYNSEDFTL